MRRVPKGLCFFESDCRLRPTISLILLDCLESKLGLIPHNKLCRDGRSCAAQQQCETSNLNSRAHRNWVLLILERTLNPVVTCRLNKTQNRVTCHFTPFPDYGLIWSRRTRKDRTLFPSSLRKSLPSSAQSQVELDQCCQFVSLRLR